MNTPTPAAPALTWTGQRERSQLWASAWLAPGTRRRRMSSSCCASGKSTQW